MNNSEKPETILARYYHRKGYMRLPNEKRRKADKQKYKKGYEVRFVAHSESELKQIRQALTNTGFKPGKPYRRFNQFIQPVYGKRTVENFKLIIQSAQK